MNPHAGADDDVDEIRSLFSGHEIDECDPDDLSDHVRDALARTPAFVAVAGGDGTIRSVVETVLATAPAVPLLAVPAGTRNHFARDLGLADLDTAAEAADGGQTRKIDVGTVNERAFVNNASVGVYPRLVAYRDKQEKRLPKGLAAVAAAWHQLRHGRRVHLTVDGQPVAAWAVFIGNNCYGESLRDLVGRERLDAGVLDVRVAHADRRLSRLRIVAAVLFGRVPESPLIDRQELSSVELGFDRESVSVALDGEVLALTPPLRFASAPGALTVLAPFSRQ